jgi:putative two-component system response regulator
MAPPENRGQAGKGTGAEENRPRLWSAADRSRRKREDPDAVKDVREEALAARILIVDDNAANVRLLEKILDQAGYRNVQSTTDPRRVTALQRENDFHLILLDIRMPHKDGFQVMEELSNFTDGGYLPILVLTAQSDMSTRMRALESGARDFLTKPFDRAEVLQRLFNMLEVRILYNRQRHQSEILEAAVRERTKDLRRSRLDIIRRLGRAGEYRDNETGRHVIRMSETCQRLALAANLGDDVAEMLLTASPMHDVGKIGIPDTILLKPGRLTPDEWEVMKAHTLIGGDILSEHPSELIGMARNIALTHHEWWGGSGYPHGLKGEDIPVEGRVTAICDVFDALTSARPYKAAWPVEDAIDYVREKAGTQFDPALAQAFLDIIDDVLEIRASHADDADGADDT